MEFLKDILGDGFAAFETAVNAWNQKPENKDKQVKIANLSSGDYVSKSKFDALSADKEGLEGQLSIATEQLKAFEGVDVAELQGRISTLNTDLGNLKADYEKKIADRDFEDLVKEAVAGAGGRSVKAVMAELDIEALKASKNQKEDVQKAVDKCKEINAWMFGINEPVNHPVTGPTKTSIVGLTKEQFKAMGYKERLELKQQDPAKYEEMKG